MNSNALHIVIETIPFKTHWNTTPLARLAGSVLLLAFCLYIGSALLQLTALRWVSIVLVMLGGGLACHLPEPQSADRSSRERSESPLPSLLRDRDWRSLLRGEIQIYQGHRDQHDVTARPPLADYRRVPSHEWSSGSILAPAFWWGTLLFLLLFVGMVNLWGVDPSPPLPPAALSLRVVGGMTVVIVLVHELIHAALAAWYGSTVSLGVSPMMAYMRPRNVVLTRRQRLLIGLAPGVCLSLLGAICVLVGSGWVLAIGVVLLFVNIPGSTGDAVLAWRRLTAPPGSLWYNPPDGTRAQRYDPVSSSPSLAARLQTRVFHATDWLKLPAENDGGIDE